MTNETYAMRVLTRLSDRHNVLLFVSGQEIHSMLGEIEDPERSLLRDCVVVRSNSKDPVMNGSGKMHPMY
jgi:hypothetical protein